jgi:hypothetical protein
MVVSNGAGKYPRPLMQNGIFGARAETRMEMVEVAACIGEKRKGGGKDSVTSRRAPWPISTPSSTILQNFKLLPRRQAETHASPVDDGCSGGGGGEYIWAGFSPPTLTVSHSLSRYRCNV